MKNYKTMLIGLSLFSMLFQGCQSSDDSTTATVYPTAIGKAVSITSDEKNAVMAPSVHALEEVANNIGNILKIHIEELNQKEAVSFNIEAFYCDISGFRTVENAEVLNIKYDACKTEESMQQGIIELTYTKTDSEWKYPKVVKLIVKENYTFNDTLLQKELIVEATIGYHEDKSVKEISSKVTGLVDFDHQTITLKGFKQEITF